jgi:hypothetical protein
MACILNYNSHSCNVKQYMKHLLIVEDFMIFMMIITIKTKIKMKMAVLWVVTPCSLVDVNRRFEDACYLHHWGYYRPNERCSKYLRNFYQTSRSNNIQTAIFTLAAKRA